MTAEPRSIITPAWVRDAVFYQIFPDRFAKSDRVEKPDNLEAWDAPPTTFGFKGGDLIGVLEHLDYLIDVGVNCLYFTPVFQSTANHRYHTHDYYRIDPILGDNAAFRELLDAAHQRGIRVVIDGVFNHASRGFYQFNHALENGEQSPYLDWFTFRDFPLHAYDDYGPPGYAAWWNLKALPKFNTANPQVREFIMRVAEHWATSGIDGWRLDVPGEIDDDSFWQEFRYRVKRINPDAYIVGEIWSRADRWLQGDQFDAVMNYQFTRACISFFVGARRAPGGLTHDHSYGAVMNLDAAAFAQSLEEQTSWNAEGITYSQLNLLDSHDTARFLTIAQGDISALKLSLLMMMTYPGAPMIYYGDEIGMQGGKDPDNRRGMLWDPANWNFDLLDHVKKYIALRKQYAVLRRPGKYLRLYAEGDVYCFARQRDDQTLIVALNAGTDPATLDLDMSSLLPDGVTLRNAWSDDHRTVSNSTLYQLQVPPRDGVVWISI